MIRPQGNPLTNENGAPVEIVVSRNGPTDQPLVVTLSSDDPSEATVPTTVTIPAGASSVTVPVTPVDDTEVDGPQFPSITATAPGFPDATLDVTVGDDDQPTITIAPDPSVTLDPDGRPVLVEGGAPVDIVISRDGPTDQPLVVTLNSDDPSEATVPTTVTIPAGASSVTVPITPVDDSEVDGPQFPTITATAPGTNPGTLEARVDDDDQPTITIAPDPSVTLDPDGRPVLVEGGAPVDIVISRDGPTDQPLVVTLNSDDPSEATVPTTVTIPAGASSVTVPITPVDDSEVDGPQFPTITATAPGTNPGTLEARVDDDDQPTITIAPDPSVTLDPDGRPVLVEGGAPVDIVISRDGPTDQPLVVTLNSDDPSEATVPTTVTIPAGASSVTVPITPVDDSEVDGPQFPTITATAPGTNPGTLEARVDDDDQPTITIAPDPSVTLDPDGRPVLVEGGAPVDIVISRDGPTDQPLVVTLNSDDPSEATVPTTVTIPAGASSVTVPITPVDDTEVDGPQFPTITATAPGTNPGTLEARVDDDDQPTITIAPDPSVTLDPDGRPVLVEGGAPVDIVISRDGPTDQPLVVTLNSDDPSEATVPTTVTIPAGASSVTVPITPVDDSEVDGPQFPTITATAPGTNPGTLEARVNDDDTQPEQLTLTPAPGTQFDANGNPVTAENGAPVNFFVTRTGPTTEPLVVTVSNGDPTETDVPQTVTIPAGIDTAVVTVFPVDDSEVDGPQTSTIGISAPGFISDSVDVVVEDDDVFVTPELTIDPGRTRRSTTTATR